MNPQEQSDYNQPVAYDKEGRPLYAHPPAQEQQAQQQIVHVARPIEPAKPEVSLEAKKRHEW
jgi:hypothetical protein